MKVFYSCAKWPNGQYTESKERNKEAAIAVIKVLIRDGYAGRGLMFPIETFVKELDEK